MSRHRFQFNSFFLLTFILFLISIFTISFLTFQPPKPSSNSSTTIVKATGSFAYQNTTNKFTTHFKAKATEPDSIVFANNLGKISFYTPQIQQFGQLNPNTPPISNDNVLTYPNIFSQVDLRYTISTSRLLEEFIIKDKSTANQIIRLKQIATTNQKYQENADGSLTFTAGDKTVFTLPSPVLYEQQDTTKRSSGIKYEIEKNNDQLIITKVITAEGIAWLNDQTRNYPIVIDLVIDNGDTASNWVSSDTTNTVVSQETTLKQEGTGSVKIQTTTETAETLDSMEYSSDANAQAAYPNQAISTTVTATGGTITDVGGFRIHTFTGNGTFTPNGAMNVEVLVVGGGGGGGGGHAGGGGGAGGYLYNSSYAVTSQAYTVTVGTGGAGYNEAAGGDGGSSSFGNLSITGGGGGASGNDSTGGRSGASGGGGSGYIGGSSYGSGTTGGNRGGGGSPGGTWVNGGGGGGAGSVGQSQTTGDAGDGGDGIASSISGTSLYYAGGGGGGGWNIAGGPGGSGIGGNGARDGVGGNATANRGSGGGGSGARGTRTGGNGSAGIVIVRYTKPLQAFSESTIKTQGNYSLKGIAHTTNSLNKTLTRTITTPVDLSHHDTVTFDLRSTRTGSNIKIGLHDSGGTTTEITPNITSANTFQTFSLDISGVASANRDAIDQIIITVVNTDADNTFYLDNIIYNGHSINDTVTLTKTATNLSNDSFIYFWVRSSVAGSFARFQFGETVSTEQTYSITINSANTWEQKTWNISGISAASRDAVTKFALQFTSNTSGATFYFDYGWTNSPPNTPTLDSPTNGATNQSLKPVLKTTATDPDSDYLRYKIQLCTDSGMTVNCQTFDQTSSQTGWSGQNVSGTAYSSGTQATYTLQSNLTANTTYYWRSYAIDPAGLNTWSSASSIYSFTVSANPTAPTNLLTEGQTNPSSISDSTPEFSAIHNDPNGDSANYYEIEVNTSAVFTGTVMWDSGQQSITTIANGARSPDISYAGTGISMNTVYYWRIRFWDTFGLVSPWSNVQTFVFNGPPGIPTINSPVDGAISQPLSPSLKTTAIDPDSDYIRYKILLCTDPDMTLNCQTFDQTASQVGWSGQNDQSNTAFLSGSMATYSLQTTLALNSVYYWKSVGIDPGGSNTWGSTQPSPASFRTVAIPYLYNGCLIEESNHDDYLRVKWIGDNNPNVEGYLVQKSVDSEAFSTVSSVGVGITAYTDNAIARGHTYQYRVIPYYTGPFYGKQCTTATLNLQSSGLLMEGIIFGN